MDSAASGVVKPWSGGICCAVTTSRIDGHGTPAKSRRRFPPSACAGRSGGEDDTPVPHTPPCASRLVCLFPCWRSQCCTARRQDVDGLQTSNFGNRNIFLPESNESTSAPQKSLETRFQHALTDVAPMQQTFGTAAYRREYARAAISRQGGCDTGRHGRQPVVPS